MVGVVGLGLLGRGIAGCLLSRGVRVVGYTLGEDSRREAKEYIAGAIDELIDRGGFSPSLREQWRTNFIEAGALSEFAPCDFIIESVPEDLSIKRSVFDQLEAVVRPSTPIASNTSALPITILQQGQKYPSRFIGMHWAEPCHLTRFLEVIRGEQTDVATAEAAMTLAIRAGKVPALVNMDVVGFIANRLGYAMYREAFWLLENGVADVETIDRSFRNAISVWGNIAGSVSVDGFDRHPRIRRRDEAASGRC